jgi:hypothetical protein
MYASDGDTGSLTYTTNDSWAFEDGNVGIGTTSPVQPLHIAGVSSLTGVEIEGNRPEIFLDHTSAAGFAGGLSFQQSGTSEMEFFYDSNNDEINIWDSIGATSRVVFERTGNVGIGTTTPSDPFHVVGSARFQESGDVSNFGQIYTASDYLYFTSYGTAADSGGMKFLVNDAGTEALTILANGNVGIGATSPISRLHVATNITTLTGKSALIVDQLESEDIFTASASGAVKMALTNDGTLQLFNASSTISNTSGDITIDAASDNISFSGDNLINVGQIDASDQVRVGNLASNPTAIGEGSIYYNTTDDKLYYYQATGWTEIGSGGGSGPSWWTEAFGVLYPVNETVDLAIGGTATASASFYVSASTGDLTLANSETISNAVNSEIALSDGTNTLTIDLDEDTTTAIDFTTNGSVNLTFNPGGNVGIGTTSPGKLLDISNTAGAAELRLVGSGGDVIHTITDEYDVNYTRTSGIAYIDFRALPGDGTSMALYRFGLNSGSTGTNRIILFEPNGATVQTQITTSGENTYFNAQGGNVGIGTTSPGELLDVAGDIRSTTGSLQIGNASNLAYSRFGTGTTNHGLNAADDVLISDGLEINGVLYPDSGIADSNGTVTITLDADEDVSLTDDLYVTGNAGIGTAGPDAKFNVQGGTDVALSGGGFIITGDLSGANMGIDDNEIMARNNGATATLYIQNEGGTTVFGGGSGKITVGTIDPVYNIGGEKFATYMAGMIGVKEETAGVIETNQYIPGVGYKHTIDFTNQERGSDLWLFSKATDIGKHIDDLIVLLSPSGNARSWYEVDRDSYTLSIYTSKPTSVSYRLTAPRFDAEDWSNYNNDLEAFGFVIEDDELTGTGEINQEIPGLSDYEIFTENTEYKIRTISGEIVEGIEAFAGLAVANIKAGAIEVTDLTVKSSVYIADTLRAGAVETASITTDTFLAFQGTVDNLLITNGLVSPVIETKIISPIADSDLIIDLDNSAPSAADPSFGELIVKGVDEQEVASIDAEGNATFSGRLESEEVKTKKITADRIYVDEIISKSSPSDESPVTIEQIEKLLRQSQEDQELLADATDSNIFTATDSANLEELVLEQLYVTGQAAINTLSVSTSLTVGSDFVVQSFVNEDETIVNSLDTLSAPLKLQSLAMTPLEIMAGKVRIDTEGNVEITGNLYVAGRIESSGLTLKDNNSENDSSFGTLLSLVDTEGIEVASIDASGSAQFATIQTDKLVIAGSEATTSASFDGLVTQTSATAGTATIPAGSRDIIIENPKVTDNTLVYVTPLTSTQNNVLYVKTKESCSQSSSFSCEPYFVIGFDTALTSSVEFNWWIIDVTNPEQ